MTNDLQNLSLYTNYEGPDELLVGDGKALPITYTGSSPITTNNHSLSLHYILHAPNNKHNLVSVSKLLQD